MSPVPSVLGLRQYQAEAVSAIESAWARDVNRPAVVMATGLGKHDCSSTSPSARETAD